MNNDNNIINNNDPIVTLKKKARDLPSYLRGSEAFNAEGLRILNHYFQAIDAGSTKIDESMSVILMITFYFMVIENEDYNDDLSFTSSDDSESSEDEAIDFVFDFLDSIPISSSSQSACMMSTSSSSLSSILMPSASTSSSSSGFSSLSSPFTNNKNYEEFLMLFSLQMDQSLEQVY